MKQILLKEDKLPTKLLVVFSSQISQKIMDIDNYNPNNEHIYQWYEYLEDIIRYLSNPVIAFDYANRFLTYPNGAKHIEEINYDVTYIVKTNNKTNQTYVFIFYINLKLEEFGLNVPSSLNENKQIIRLTECEFYEFITHAVKNLINEYKDSQLWGWKYIYKNRHNNLSKDEINDLHKLYDKYAKKTASRGEIPNDTGFDLWKIKNELNAYNGGNNSIDY